MKIKILSLVLIAILAVSAICCQTVSAKTYYYNAHLEVGKTYGLGDGSNTCVPYKNIRAALDNGNLDYYVNWLAGSEWDSLTEKLVDMGIATKTGHSAMSIWETYDLTPTVKGHWENVPVDMGKLYDTDYFDVIFT
jgi:hypothetical protein